MAGVLGLGSAECRAAVTWPALDASDRAFYDAIYAPTVVGEQPNHTHKEMVRLPDGELRYYGTDKLAGVRTNVVSVSRDRGLSWKERLWDAKTEIGPMAYCPWGDYYFTGECLGNWGKKDEKVRFQFVTTKGGPTDLATKVERTFPIPAALDFFRPMQPFELSRTIAFGGACHVYDPVTKRSWERPSVIFSDDDGKTWRATVVTNCVTTGGVPVFNDKSPRWDNGCCESTLVELSTGELWMACRASLRHHYLFKSKDGGRTWSKPEPMRGFYASNTMPTFLKLKDGRILFFWNNTEPLAKRALSEYPELPPYAKTGTGETVFTNRDALHVAISEDDGKTWIGFREVALNALRNCEDYRARGNDRPEECDKSVHQTQPMELPGGKILLPYGQGAARRICIFDLKWLYEKKRFDDFWWGTEGLSNHLYLKSLNGGCRAWDAGHCAFNRIPGACIVREPDTGKDTIRECLQVCRIRDERLVSELQGVAWNFPAAVQGELEIECRIDGAGFNLALCDRWINPGDEHAQEYAALSVPVEAETLGGACRWTKLRLVWDWKAQRATLFANGKETPFTFDTKELSPYGPSYLHVQTRAAGHDPKGTYFRSFGMRALEDVPAVKPPTSAVVPDVASWHGANLLGLFNAAPQKPDPRVRGQFEECYFRWMKAWDLNFARLPMDYRYFLATNDWTKLKPEGFAAVDQAVAWGRKYGVHVQLCLHRAPGYTITSWIPEKEHLQYEPRPQQAFMRIWREFARRYRGVPNAELSFNLINEPTGFSEEQFISVFGRTVDAIHAEDPGRFVMLDGNHCASTPVKHFYGVPLTGQAFRGYTPHAISHYKAWYIKDQPEVEPVWPLSAEMAKRRSWIYEDPSVTLAKFAEPRKKGYPVMIGEFGCYNKLNHATCLAWMEDCLKRWKALGLGWAIWNVDGAFGFMDSDRTDVQYKDFEGHKLDRKMLDLLRRYAKTTGK